MRENDLLQHIYATSGGLASQFPGVSIPPGDDMGAVAVGGQIVLMTVDQVADGVHVDLANTPLAKVGRKCITRNLSDVAAMAARPVGAVAAACLPRDFGEANATALFDAMRATAERYACPLIGGDISMWDGKLIVTVTIFAEPAGIEPIRRGTARPGDGLYVTGALGNSLATGHHLDFEPRIELARQLAGDPRTRPTAMIDLSDGLAQDLPRLTDHALIEAALLPIRAGTPGHDDSRWRHAVGDGEDYELLFALAPEGASHLPRQIDGVPITRIGRVAGDGGVCLALPDGQRPALEGMGWEHVA